MQSSAKTVQEYLKELPADRREAIDAVRGVILANLPKGYEECMSYGMIGYVVPHSIYPKGYQCNPKLPLPFVNLGSQKNHMALHLMCCYGDPKLKAWFEKPYQNPLIAVSVDIMSTGVDIPCLRYIGFASLTKSVGKYIQMLGRGTRLDPKTGKFSFRILDFVTLCKRMGDNGKGTIRLLNYRCVSE